MSRALYGGKVVCQYRNAPVLRMKRITLYAILITAALMEPSSVFATSTRLQDTAQQFTSGGADHNQTQVRGEAEAGKVELLFQFQNLNITNPPGARDQSSFAYEQGINTGLLYGGYNGTSNALSDTWEFSPAANTWLYIAVSTVPPGRYGHGVAALGTGEFLMFGGKDANANIYNNETWIYNGTNNTWRQLTALSTAPCARAFFAVAYDTATHRSAIFGGRDSAGTLLNDAWIFDGLNSTWTVSRAGGGPSARTGAAMAYNLADGFFYLFGGSDAGGKKQDLWQYNPNADTWAELTPPSKPDARENAVLFYDSKNARLGLWGGTIGISDTDDTSWYYSTNNLWYSGVALSTPLARTRHTGAWLGRYDKMLFFGGSGGTRLNDTSCLVQYSSGIFTSAPFDAYQNGTFSTDYQWTTLRVTPVSQPATTLLKFQVASSTDNVTWSAFSGVGGLENLYYSGASSYSLWNGHNNRRYLRYRAYLTTTQPPTSPAVDSVEIVMNFAPYAPTLSAPLSGSTTGSMLPYYYWQNAIDPDNASVYSDTITYHVQASSSSGFGSTVVNALNISSATASLCVFHSTNTLHHGIWYWRVQAYDGIAYGPWSSTYTLLVDTVPPEAVSTLSAAPGSANGQVLLSVTLPYDSNPGTPTRYFYEVRYATFGPINESIYQTLGGQQRTGSFSASAPGTVVELPINGLADATTFYFSIKITDEAGNQSSVSSVTPYAFTNAPPAVSFTRPSAGTIVTRASDLAWISSDPNPGDTRTFAITASLDGGGSFTVLVASGIAYGTTFYTWDTRQVANTTNEVMRITATDVRGLSGSAVSPAFTVSNENELPVVTIVAPAVGGVLSGPATVYWNVSDPNKADTHTFTVMISSDSGTSFAWSYVTALTSQYIDTRLMPNGVNYVVKITAADSGSPVLSGFDQHGFAISNNNLAPAPFHLLSPANGSTRSPLNLEFRWEPSIDPNPEDVITYTVIISSRSDFAYSSRLSAGTSTVMTIPPDLLSTEVLYYWVVEARDPFGLTSFSEDTFWAVVFSRFKTETPDGRIQVSAVSGLPDNGMVMIEAVSPAGSALYADAVQDTVADRHVKYLNDTIYDVSVRGVNNVLIPSDAVTFQLVETYPDANGDGAFDGTSVPVGNLRCARLNSSARKWDLLPDAPVVDRSARTLSSRMAGAGAITLVGALVPASGVSSLMNYPNPFNAGAESTNIKYVLTENRDVAVKIYTMMGDLVWHADFAEGTPGARGQETGYTNDLTWDGRNDAGMLVANGMYLMEISAGSDRQLRKIGVLKK